MKNNVTGAYVVIFDGDGRMDLARAGAFDSVGTKFNSGAVDVLHGSSLKRLGASNNQLWKQDSSGGDSAELDDHFGWALSGEA